MHYRQGKSPGFTLRHSTRERFAFVVHHTVRPSQRAHQLVAEPSLSNSLGRISILRMGQPNSLAVSTLFELQLTSVTKIKKEIKYRKWFSNIPKSPISTRYVVLKLSNSLLLISNHFPYHVSYRNHSHYSFLFNYR